MGPHDGRYKLFFSYRRMMEDLVSGFLHGSWRQGLELGTLEPVPTDFVSGELVQRQGDCLWRARFRSPEGAATDFYLLVEFQSRPDRYMPLRLLCYEALLLERLVRRRELAAGGALPPVVALVIPRGTRRWNVPRELRELFSPVTPDAARLLPCLSYLLVDRRGGGPGAPGPPDNIVAAFFRIEDARSPGELLDLARPLARMLPRDDEPGLRRAFTDLLIETFRTTFPEVRITHVEDLEELQMLEQNMMRWRRTFIRETKANAREEARKWAQKKVQMAQKELRQAQEQIREQVQEEVRAQVQEEVRAQVQEEVRAQVQEEVRDQVQEIQIAGMRRLLQRQMELRFGPLPPAVRRRIGEISSAEQLEELAGRLLTAASLPDLGFAGDE